MRKLLSILFIGALLSSPALADWTGKDASNATITFKNSGTCSSVVCVPIAEPVDATGAAFGVTGNPFFVSPASGATFPVSASALPLPTGAGTSANQASILSALNTGNTSLATIATNTGAPLPACSTAPCTLTAANVGADPSSGKGTPMIANQAFPATTTTQIIALSGTTKIYVTNRLLMAGGSVNVTFKYGTGTNCGTGTTTLDGPWPLTAQAGFSEGNGSGPVLIVPAGNALCVTTDASVSGATKLVYQQF